MKNGAIASNAPANTFMAAGTGKQRLHLIPSPGFVVVRCGRAHRTFSYHFQLRAVR